MDSDNSQIISDVEHGPSWGTQMANLERPVPLLGLKSQHLGDVHRVCLSAETRRLVQVELTTRWQRLRVDAQAIDFDPDEEVFRIALGGSHSQPIVAHGSDSVGD